MDNISEIISSLSDKDIENLKDVAQSVFGGEEKGESFSDDGGIPDLGSINPEIIGKVSRIISMMNRKDPRCDLITALKPLLSADRQKRADEAVQILKLINLIPLLKERGDF